MALNAFPENMIRVAFAVLVYVALLRRVQSAGSGRALPIDAENYVTEQFQSINHILEWDHSNFLVDLSGHYANCKHMRRHTIMKIIELTPAGHDITAGIDFTHGFGTDVESVNSYIIQLVDEWMKHGIFFSLITGSDRFGCSVRPGCKGRVIVSCLFSNSRPYTITRYISPSTTRRIWTLPTLPTPYPFVDTTTTRPIPDWTIHGGKTALAFTPQQYDLIKNRIWDRSHLLENLSGFETDCAMIDAPFWSFAKASDWANNAGMRVNGIFGSALNRGSTEEAMIVILKTMDKLRTASKVGCSLIPDCIRTNGHFREMFVVISCLFER